MLQRRTGMESPDFVTCITNRPSTTSCKVTVKEKKAAKRKEKSRVAAQIRRNKESQTLILLQNALPLALPSPSQMLEKSIVIRIAGQTLFLMNTLDQVLGMDGWLTIPLISNNFLTFFVDCAGQIVYASPNIQLLLEQYHWSNLIGMSIYDVIDFKCRWPTVGEVVRMKLTTTSTIPNDQATFVISPSATLQPSCSRTTIASRLNLKKNSQAWNNSSSTCSLYNVWCCTNISHTNSKLKLLILQAVKIKSSILVNNDSTKPVILSNPNNSMLSVDRSASWPPVSNPILMEQTIPATPSSNVHNQSESHCNPNPKCIYQRMMTSGHDKYYNFKSASTEFSQLICEVPGSVIGLNFLDIIHLEDVITVKSFLDLIVENNDSHIWTPIYRIMCGNGRQCVVKTLAKQYSHSLILNHLIIETTKVDDEFADNTVNERCRLRSVPETFISMSSDLSHIGTTSKHDTFFVRSESDNGSVQKRKTNDRKRIVSCEKYPRFVNHSISGPAAFGKEFPNPLQSSKSSLRIDSIESCTDSKLDSEILNNDPFLPLDFVSHSTNRRSRKDDLSSFGDCMPKLFMSSQHKSNQHGHHKYNRSPSYSLESCVLTSPGSESTDIPLDENFSWDVTTGFPELNPLTYWLDDQD